MRDTPLVEVNQADIAWSIGQGLSTSQQHLNHDMTMTSEHDIPSSCVTMVQRGCVI